MGLFSNQFSNVIEWEEFRDDMLFWKWDNKEIKKATSKELISYAKIINKLDNKMMMLNNER